MADASAALSDIDVRKAEKVLVWQMIFPQWEGTLESDGKVMQKGGDFEGTRS